MTQFYPELGFTVIGGHVHDPRPAFEQLRRGEKLGLGSVWISERPGTKDIGALCGTAVGAAPKLGVASCLISNLPVRNPLTVASFASTMMLMNNNQFVLGVGHGQDSLADMTGVARSTRANIGRYIDTLRQLWSGETVTAAQDGWVLNDAKLGSKLDVMPPIYMGAVGDRTLAWAGANCEGVILFSCLDAEAVSRSVRVVKNAALEAGRDPSAVKVIGLAVTACDVSEEKMLNYIVRRMNTYFMLPMIDTLVAVNRWDPKTAATIKQAVFGQAKQGQGALRDEGVTHELDELRRFRDLYPPNWITQFNAVGSAEDGTRYIRSLFDAGVDKVVLHGSPPADFGSLIDAWPAQRPHMSS